MIFRRHLDWLRLGSIGQPLFQEQGCCGAVKSSTAITMQMMAFSGSPAAAVFVHKGHGKGQGTSQTNSVALAVFRLLGGFAELIERESHHQRFDPAFSAELLQLMEIVTEDPPFQRVQWCHSHSKRVASSQSDPSAAHIKAENRSRSGRE